MTLSILGAIWSGQYQIWISMPYFNKKLHSEFFRIHFPIFKVYCLFLPSTYFNVFLQKYQKIKFPILLLIKIISNLYLFYIKGIIHNNFNKHPFLINYECISLKSKIFFRNFLLEFFPLENFQESKANSLHIVIKESFLCLQSPFEIIFILLKIKKIIKKLFILFKHLHI